MSPGVLCCCILWRTTSTTTATRADRRAHRPFTGRASWLERMHFADPPAPRCGSTASSCLSEDLAPHDARHDIRTPIHELTIARDLLRANRQAGRFRRRACVACAGSGPVATTSTRCPAAGRPAGRNGRRGCRGRAGAEPDASDPLVAELAIANGIIAAAELENVSFVEILKNGTRAVICQRSLQPLLLLFSLANVNSPEGRNHDWSRGNSLKGRACRTG